MQTRLCLALLGITLLFGFNPGKAQQDKTDFQPSPVIVTHTVDTLLGKAYFVHQVQKGHTLYSICKAYKVEAGQILKDSPDSEVQIGEFLYIPLDEDLITGMEPLQKFKGKRPWAVVFYERDHQGETSYSSDMGSRGKNKDKVKTKKNRRKRNKDKDEPVAIPTEIPIDTVVEDIALQQTEPEEKRIRRKAHKDSLQVALLLPLYSQMPENRRAYIYLPYFEGASIAWIEYSDSAFFAPAADSSLTSIDSLLQAKDSLQPKWFHAQMPSPIHKPKAGKKKPGLKFRVYDIAQTLYATDQYSRSLHNTLNDPELLKSDVIVAGAFVNQFPLIDSFSRQYQIPLIHPFSERDSMATGNPWFMQASASSMSQIRKVAELVKNNFPDTAIVVIISDSSQTERAKARKLHQLLPGSKRYLFNPVTQILLEDLVMDTAVVIIPFYQEEITAVKTFLPLRQGQGNITIIAPATWLEYSTTDVDYFLQNNLTVYSTFHADKGSPEFKEFARKYYMVYHGMPSTLAYQGYLCLNWLMNMLAGYNADFMRHIEDAETNPFLLEERPSGGFESSDIRIFRLSETGLEELYLPEPERGKSVETTESPVQRPESFWEND